MNNNVITAQERKNRSIAILQAQNVPYIEHLPFRYETEEVTPRDKKEVIERAVCSFASIMCALSISKGEYSQEDRVYAEDFLSEKYNVLELLTPMEQQVIAGTISEAGAMNATWKYELLWVLLWALGIVEELSFPNEICDCDLVMGTMKRFKGLDDFMANTTLRPLEEILQALDLHYRYHWVAVNARVNGSDPAGIDEEVVMERRAGLEWLCCKGQENDNLSDTYNAWDYPELDT
ncbi:DUF4272 domain-containing protein [Capnocytophaga gingivalis]|uniref:DUF4272 domain-containing protein n=1 Tax=Capnocytophaga gingivalis TaxID=1017 RepID=A0ABU5Y7I9_9FLAO|nr:DUF4272 domain-containing protein [Capnocytophaga gingivalis]MEB3039745.1 DUF4272 domain-containing protein [Capnocytophaga gingivalis]